MSNQSSNSVSETKKKRLLQKQKLQQLPIVSIMMDIKNRESTNLPLYEHQLQEVSAGIQNVLNAIQLGTLTKSK